MSNSAERITEELSRRWGSAVTSRQINAQSHGQGRSVGGAQREGDSDGSVGCCRRPAARRGRSTSLPPDGLLLFANCTRVLSTLRQGRV